MKRNETPQNVEVARQINLRRNRNDKYSWIPCIVCGDLCPQQLEGTFADYDEVHMTCTQDPSYPKRLRELKKRREEEEASSSLF